MIDEKYHFYFNQGYDNCWQGSKEDCPYFNDTEEYEVWMEGYHMAIHDLQTGNY